MKQKDFRSVDSATRQEIRKMAIKKIASGVQKKIVADFYDVNQNTITNWVKKHKEKGLKAWLIQKEALSLLIKNYLITHKNKQFKR